MDFVSFLIAFAYLFLLYTIIDVLVCGESCYEKTSYDTFLTSKNNDRRVRTYLDLLINLSIFSLVYFGDFISNKMISDGILLGSVAYYVMTISCVIGDHRYFTNLEKIGLGGLTFAFAIFVASNKNKFI